MNKQESPKTAEASRGRYKRSIVYKLDLKLFLRLLSIFISIDVLIFLLGGFSAAVYSERRAATAAEAVFSSGSTPDEKAIDAYGRLGIEIKEYTKHFQLLKVPESFKGLFPEYTENARRGFILPDTDDTPLAALMPGLIYDVVLDKGATSYEITVPLGEFSEIFWRMFSILLIFELIAVIIRAFSDARMVRLTLSPIYELTAATEILNKAGNQFDPEKMEALAGKLEGINAARLDTRIQVSDTQDELKSLAKAINDMLDRINDSYRAQVRFVSDASHELRTPISVIQGYSNLLDRWGKNDEKILQESISAIRDEAANMKELVEQLLFLARGDNNTIKLQIERISLSELVNEVVHETQMIDSSHSYEARGEDAFISADRGLIKQALRILVDNAIKYTPSGGHIAVGSNLRGEEALLSVQDDGIGIVPEAVPKIFDRFYRADESRTRATGGAGLGLSIAKWITQRHSGSMEVLSREGIGTRITLVLPAAGTSPLAPAEPEI